MKKYPIYTVSAKWSQDGDQDPKYPKWYEGLPEGRIWNSTSFTKMFKEELTEEELKEFAEKWWGMFLAHNENHDRNPVKNVEGLQLTYKLKEFEEWNLTWFQHETFDEGQSDAEVLQSFSDYVDRVQRKNQEIEWNYPEEEWYKQGYRTLMGAEDRWRWHGAEPNGEPGDHSPAPCRCKHCKEQGVIRIAH